MIRNIKGDALKTDYNLLVHQTNCVGVMGAGIAKQIKEQLLDAKAFNLYRVTCKEYGAKLLGKVQFLKIADSKYVANVFGENIPTGKRLDTNYEALRKGLQKVHDIALEKGWKVTIPGLIGCGLAGGDWNYVLHGIIEPIFANSEVELTIAYFLEDDFKKYVIGSDGPIIWPVCGKEMHLDEIIFSDKGDSDRCWVCDNHSDKCVSALESIRTRHPDNYASTYEKVRDAKRVSVEFSYEEVC